MAIGIECPTCGFPLAGGFCPYCKSDVRPIGHINATTRRAQNAVAAIAVVVALGILASIIKGKE